MKYEATLWVETFTNSKVNYFYQAVNRIIKVCRGNFISSATDESLCWSVISELNVNKWACLAKKRLKISRDWKCSSFKWQLTFRDTEKFITVVRLRISCDTRGKKLLPLPASTHIRRRTNLKSILACSSTSQTLHPVDGLCCCRNLYRGTRHRTSQDPDGLQCGSPWQLSKCYRFCNEIK